MICTVIGKEESTEMGDISEPEITLDPAIIYECIESDRVYDYYLDELEENDADQVANHLEDCSYCQEVYNALEKVVTTLRGNPEKFFAKEMARRGTRRKKIPKAMEAKG